MNSPRLSLGLVLTLSLAAAPGPALAMETPPAPAPARDFRLPPVTRYTLPNGLKVTLVPYGKVPKVALGLVVRAGNIDEGPKETGLADLTGDYVQEGTTTQTAKGLAEAASGYGGELSVVTSADETAVRLEVLEEFGGPAVALVADVARHPAFPEAELARLKADIVRQTTLAKSQPQPVAHAIFARATFGAHPYGRVFPDLALVSGFTRAQVEAFYKRTYAANRAHLYVVGRYDEAAMRAAVEKAFGDWPKAPPGSRPVAHAVWKPGVLLVDHPGALQSSIILGRPVLAPSSKDYVAQVVMNSLLGGIMTSRITSNIRERRGYTYSPSSRVGLHPNSAVWGEFADVTTNVTAAALQEVKNEVETLRKTPPTAEELASFQRYVSGSFVLANSSRAGIMGQLRFVDLHGLPDDWLSTYVQRVNALTPADVQRVAKKALDPKQMTLVIVGDRKAIEPSLKPFGKLTATQDP